MRIDEVPFKTAAGVDELARRLRGVSQRHRTVLLLVDGRRTLQQVLALAEAAGVPAGVFDELQAMQLVAVPGIDSIIRLACIVHKTDYWRRGRTLDKLGIGNLSVSEITRYVEEGQFD